MGRERRWLSVLFVVAFLFLGCFGEREEEEWSERGGWESVVYGDDGWKEDRQELMCHPYVLEDECGEVLSSTNVPPPAQEGRFRLLAQSISDVRMIPRGCRRPLIWFTCTAGMDAYDCSNQTSRQDEDESEPLGDRFFSWCEQVDEACGGALNCTQLATLASIINGVPPPSGGDVSSSAEIPGEYEPIPVYTCQNGEEQLDCCFDPYLVADTGECVLGCGKVNSFSDAKQKTSILTAKILLWGGMGLIIIFVTPFVFTENFFKFPNYALPLSIFFQIILINVLFWTVYTGDPTDDYFCRGTVPLGVAFADLVNSFYCPMQFGIYGFLFLVTVLWQLILVIMLINVAYRNNVRYFSGFFQLFHSPRYLAKTEIATHLIIYSIAACFSVPTAILVNDRMLLGASPPLYICWKGGEDIALLLWIPLLLFLTIDLCGLSFVLILWMCRNFMLLKIHWRLMAVLIHNIFVFGIANVTIWFMGQRDGYADRTSDYATCTAQNPNEDGVCEMEEGVFWYWYFFYLVLMSWPIASCLFVYGTNSHCKNWWFHLITTRSILREGEQSSKNQNTPVKRYSSHHSGGGGSGSGQNSGSWGHGSGSGSGSGLAGGL